MGPWPPATRPANYPGIGIWLEFRQRLVTFTVAGRCRLVVHYRQCFGRAISPARRDVLRFEVLVDPFESALAPQARLLDATERRRRIRDQASIQPDHADF